MSDDTDTEDDESLLDELEPQLSVQKARQLALENGTYNLDYGEGFICPKCGWQGLTAPLNPGADDPDAPLVKCKECQEPIPQDSTTPTQWRRVVEKLTNGSHEVDLSDD